MPPFRLRGVYQGESTPLESVPVYLFTSSGSYLNTTTNTDNQGQVVFSLPVSEYQVRVDFLSRQFWSENFAGVSAAVTIPMAEAEVTVTSGGGNLAGIPVYVFNSAGTYLGINGTTDSQGRSTFRLPAGDYRFRGDYQGAQYWSEDMALVADQVQAVAVDVGGGDFMLTLQESAGHPIAGIPCYLFTEAGSYLGLTANTTGDGTVSFDTAAGSYKIRVDYLGYHYWTPVFRVPDAFSMTFDILHRDCAVQVTGAMAGADESRAGVPVYLFTPENAYLGKIESTGRQRDSHLRPAGSALQSAGGLPRHAVLERQFPV